MDNNKLFGTKFGNMVDFTVFSGAVTAFLSTNMDNFTITVDEVAKKITVTKQLPATSQSLYKSANLFRRHISGVLQNDTLTHSVGLSSVVGKPVTEGDKRYVVAVISQLKY